MDSNNNSGQAGSVPPKVTFEKKEHYSQDDKDFLAVEYFIKEYGELRIHLYFGGDIIRGAWLSGVNGFDRYLRTGVVENYRVDSIHLSRYSNNIMRIFYDQEKKLIFYDCFVTQHYYNVDDYREVTIEMLRDLEKQLPKVGGHSDSL